MGRFSSSAARAWRLALLLAVIAAALTVGAVGAVAEDDPQRGGVTRNSLDADAPAAGGVFGSGPAFKTGRAICTTAVQSVAGNVNTDCDATAPNGVTNPHNETSIAVNPTNALNILGGA